MRFVAGIAAPFLLLLAGCLSAPVPQELVDATPVPAPEPLHIREILRLSKAGISDEVIVGLIRTRGIADRPNLKGITMLPVSTQVQLYLLASPAEAPPQKPQPRIVYREFYIPLWPSYSRGHWHLGLRVGCYTKTEEGEVQEILPPEPDSSPPLPRFIEP